MVPFRSRFEFETTIRKTLFLPWSTKKIRRLCHEKSKALSLIRDQKFFEGWNVLRNAKISWLEKMLSKFFKDLECIVQIEYLKCYFSLFRVIWWMKNRFCYKISFSITNLGYSSYQKFIVFYRLDLITNFEGNLCKKAGVKVDVQIW